MSLSSHLFLSLLIYIVQVECVDWLIYADPSSNYFGQSGLSCGGLAYTRSCNSLSTAIQTLNGLVRTSPQDSATVMLAPGNYSTCFITLTLQSVINVTISAPNNRYTQLHVRSLRIFLQSM